MAFFGLFGKKEEHIEPHMMVRPDAVKVIKPLSDKDADSIITKNLKNFNNIHNLNSSKKWTNVIEEKDEDSDDDGEEFRTKWKDEERRFKQEQDLKGAEKGEKSDEYDMTKISRIQERSLARETGGLEVDPEERREHLQNMEEIEEGEEKGLQSESEELAEDLEEERDRKDTVRAYGKYRKKRKMKKMAKKAAKVAKKGEGEISHVDALRERRSSTRGRGRSMLDM